MSWTKSVFLMLAVVLAGCANSETEQTIKMLEAKNRSLANDNNMLVDQNQQLSSERNVFRAKFEAEQGKVSGYQRNSATYEKLIAAKDTQIARERAIAEQNLRTNTGKTVINVPTGHGGATRPATGPGVGPTKSGATKGRYHLRIISLPGNSRSEKTVREMTAFLTKNGISNVVPRKSGRYWVIDIGHFNSIRSGQATALKTKVRSLRYKGIKQFRSAYFAQY